MAHHGRKPHEDLRCQQPGAKDVQRVGHREHLDPTGLHPGREITQRSVEEGEIEQGKVERGLTALHRGPAQGQHQQPKTHERDDPQQTHDQPPVHAGGAQRHEREGPQGAGEALHVLSLVEDEAALEEEQIVDVTEVDEGVVQQPRVTHQEQQPTGQAEPLQSRRFRQGARARLGLHRPKPTALADRAASAEGPATRSGARAVIKSKAPPTHRSASRGSIERPPSRSRPGDHRASGALQHRSN